MASGFDYDEFAEIVLEQAGGYKRLAEKLLVGVESANAMIQSRSIAALSQFLKKAGLKKTGPSSMTDDEIDEALDIEFTRHFVSMPEEEFNATLAKITRARRGTQVTKEERDGSEGSELGSAGKGHQ